jgi:osmotically inducible protein OsmC
MAFAGRLGDEGYEPEWIETEATCVLTPQKSGGFAITGMRLHVRGRVPGLDQDEFEQIAARADKGCPVSNLLRSGLTIEHHVTLVE